MTRTFARTSMTNSASGSSTEFGSVREALETRLTEWDGNDEEDGTEDGTPKKGLHEKKRKKLLDAKTWERDARLVETAKPCEWKLVATSTKITTFSATG